MQNKTTEEQSMAESTKHSTEAENINNNNNDEISKEVVVAEGRSKEDLQEERELAGKVALVTGGSRGIGRACAVLLAKAGADVAINYVSNESEAIATQALIQDLCSNSSRCLIFKADVSDTKQVDEMIAQVRSSLGPISIVVNNAGKYYLSNHRSKLLCIYPFFLCFERIKR